MEDFNTWQTVGLFIALTQMGIIGLSMLKYEACEGRRMRKALQPNEEN